MNRAGTSEGNVGTGVKGILIAVICVGTGLVRVGTEKDCAGTNVVCVETEVFVVGTRGGRGGRGGRRRVRRGNMRARRGAEIVCVQEHLVSIDYHAVPKHNVVNDNTSTVP